MITDQDLIAMARVYSDVRGEGGQLVDIMFTLADRLEELTRWRPIESAPRTGRRILLRYFNDLGKRRVVKASWVSEDEIAEWENGDLCEPGWYERSEAHEAVTETIYPVEHEPNGWLPLPAEPKPAQEGL